jgi:hypothetical protein
MTMTVKERGVGDLHSPAPIHFRGALHHAKASCQAVCAGVMTCVDAVKRFMGYLQQAG